MTFKLKSDIPTTSEILDEDLHPKTDEPISLDEELKKSEELTTEDILSIVTGPDLKEVFRESIPNLISIIKEVNPREKDKIIGKLQGALELFNS